jgi:tetratricopeptide (TPR) repeat protein
MNTPEDMNAPKPPVSIKECAAHANPGSNAGSLVYALVSAPKTTVGDWDALIQNATLAYQRSDAAEARKCLTSAGAEIPGRCDQILGLGYIRLNLGDFPEAAAWFSHAVRLSPELAHTHSSRALAFALANQPAEARTDAEHALTIDPQDSIALKVLTRICLDLKDMEQARKLCDRILKLNPGDADAQTMIEQAAVTMPVVENDKLIVKLPVATSAPQELRLSKQLQSLEGLLGDYHNRCETWQTLGVEHLLQQLVVGDFKRSVEITPAFAPQAAGSDGLPIPPAELTMGYGAGNMDQYIACGRRSYESLAKLLRQQQVELGSGDAMLDWGGAAGRVVRNFIAEARRGCQVWGCDVHAPSIQWAQNHLSPPFRFFNSSALPHLPFPDRHFKFIYGLSVVTHMIALRDLWLLELHRVLRPDGCLILTVHNESTWQWFRKHGMPPWMPSELKALPEMPGEDVEIRGSRWEYCYTFFHSDYLRRIWGQYFELKEIVPCAEGYQTAVVMKPRLG